MATESFLFSEAESVVQTMAADQEISGEKTVAPKRTDEKMAPKLDTTACPFCGDELLTSKKRFAVTKIVNFVG